MSFKSSKIYIIISFFFLLNSCGLLRSDNRDINYKIVDFEENTPPEKPTYENVEDWLVHPQKDQKDYPFLDKNNGLMRADVFFIVPTLFTDKRNKNWNSDVYDNDFANTMMESTIKYQSTAWLDSGNLYSPNYRQAHFKVFDEFRWENGGKRAFELAYEDIKRSFEVYLQKYNEGRPIIIAGHSQGSGHAIRLLQDFFDGKKLKSKLIAAYLPGTRVTSNDFFDFQLNNFFASETLAINIGGSPFLFSEKTKLTLILLTFSKTFISSKTVVFFPVPRLTDLKLSFLVNKKSIAFT